MTEFRCEKVWHHGSLVDWKDATVHVSTHALHYGTSWFEGIRCYKSSRGSEVFRLREHVERLYNSCKIYRTDIPYSIDEFIEAILETIRANEFQHCYIRPLIIRSGGSLGVDPLKAGLDYYIMVWEWGRYLGEEAMDAGVDICVSSWFRAAPNTFPNMAKAGGNYVASGLVKMDAIAKGFVEGVALDTSGYVSEGSGENIVLVHKGTLYTAPISGSILPGITRDSVLTFARERGYEIREELIPREMLYIADEVFFVGTAAEVTPIRSIDRITVGSGRRGPITTELQQDFFDYVEGKVPDRHGWMTSVYKEAQVETT